MFLLFNVIVSLRADVSEVSYIDRIDVHTSMMYKNIQALGKCLFSRIYNDRK